MHENYFMQENWNNMKYLKKQNTEKKTENE